MPLRVSDLLAAALLLSASAALAEPAFIGTQKCKTCHIKQYRSWAETQMAQAFELLKPEVEAKAKKKAGLDPDEDYTQDEKCLPCHTTGYGQPGGFGSDGVDDEKLQGVGCEMCHGAGGEYVRDDRMSDENLQYKTADLLPYGYYPKPDEARCSNCHNEKSPFFKPFEYEKRVKDGTHEHFPLKFEH